MTPTDEQLNESMARACGWRRVTGTEAHAPEMFYKPDTWLDAEGRRSRAGAHDYCNDRNALPEVYAALEAAGATEKYLMALRRLVDDGAAQIAYGQWWAVQTAEPRLQVIAALRALNRWPAEWTLPE